MAADSPTIEVAVVGVGRMGAHHARVYGKVPGAKLVAVVDRDEERAATLADSLGCAFHTSTSALLDRHPGVRAVSIAVPTRYHLAEARPLLERGIACLVEKPMAPSVAEARELADLAQRCRALLQVGQIERFNPAVRAVAAMGIPVRFLEVHRVSPLTFRSLDVGVVMDMMIHDLDIVLMLANSPLARVDAAGVAVVGRFEDVANARLVFENGCVATLIASRLALKTERRLRVIGEQAYVSLDYQKRSGIVIGKSDNAAALAHLRQQLADGADLSQVKYQDIVKVTELTMDVPPGEEDPLTAELASFVRSVRSGQRPVVDADAGYAAVAAAERVCQSIREHRWDGRAAEAILH